jgi:predicted nucleic acid-binding protein
MTGLAACRAAPVTAEDGEPTRVPPVVIDTNLVLDLLVFGDPAVAPLRAALRAHALRWLATDAMRAELARVLGYPQIARWLVRERLDAGAVLADYDASIHRVPAVRVPHSPCCDDPDDQHFVELAVAHRAVLLSKDGAVLALSRRLRALDVAVACNWAPALTGQSFSAIESISFSKETQP